VTSSFFEDSALFPKGSIEFDCALLMCGIEHEWHGRSDLCCPAGGRQERQSTTRPVCGSTSSSSCSASSV
jgi:hypothetical protein